MGSEDVGIKMSQPGYDVSTVPDANVYFSSSWPWLLIALEGEETLGGTSLVVSHPLNYPPFAMVWSSINGFSPDKLSITKTAVTITGVPGEVVHYYIFYLPLNKAYDSENLLTTPDPQLFADHDTGIKMTKPGRDITSTDYRDFTIHSGTRSPLLHKVVYAPLAAIQGGDYNGIFGLKWTNDLPYFPVYFPFFSADGLTWRILSSVAQVPPKVNFDGLAAKKIVALVINDLGATTGFGSFVVLKDPFDSPQVQRVVI